MAGRIVGVALVSSMCVLSTSASAQEIENIGQTGQIVFGVERVTGVFVDELTVVNEVEEIVRDTNGDPVFDPITGEIVTRMVRRDETSSNTTVALFGVSGSGPFSLNTSPASAPRLALDFFPVKGFSIGGSFVYLTRSGEFETEGSTTRPLEVTTSTLILYPRLGYAAAFNETVGLWPRAGIAYERDTLTIEQEQMLVGPDPVTIKEERSMSFTNLVLELLLFVSPMKHFALVGGPYAEIGLAGTYTEEITVQGPPGLEVPPDVDQDANMMSFGIWAGVVGYY